MLTAGKPVLVSGPMAREMLALGRATESAPPRQRTMAEAPKPAGEDLTALRAEYREKLGKNPFNGWDAATLREKIAAA
jgi:hypothetical protein